MGLDLSKIGDRRGPLDPTPAHTQSGNVTANNLPVTARNCGKFSGSLQGSVGTWQGLSDQTQQQSGTSQGVFGEQHASTSSQRVDGVLGS